MTKPITSVATLILAERRLLSLDDPIDKYLPEFKNIVIMDASYNRTGVQHLPTIRNILTHTSGIGSDPDKLSAMTANDKKTLDASIDFYVRNGLDFEPGTKQWYSGTGAFDVLTKIIEIVSGMDYATFLQKEIFQPCGMTDTTFIPTPEQQERMVEMHTQVNGENAIYPMPDGCIFDTFPSTHYLGGAGLVSTLNDYGKFAKMLLNQGQTENGAVLLKEKTFKQLCTPQVPKDIMPDNARWGLGVRVITGKSYPYLPQGSYGWSGAYGTHFWIDPVNKIFAVFMKNSNVDGGAGNESAVKFEKAVYSSLIK
jgi:CubicO group peptidase (beta-lactamase class C family)